MTWCPWPTFHALLTLSKFYVEPRNKVHFSVAVIAGNFETLHSICAWHSLWAHTMTRCPWPTFHAPLPLSNFYVESRNKMHFSAAAMAVSMKPCIVVVFDTLFKHTSLPIFRLTYIARCSYFTKCRCDICLRGVLVSSPEPKAHKVSL